MDSDERIFEIELERLKDFPQHPFKVLEDRQMIELMESIRKYGVLNPLIVRPVPEGFYEIISGHRRKYAAEHLGYRKVPVIIRTLKDEEAIVFLVDSNYHREVIAPSEKAFALKMKYDALKRSGSSRKAGSQDDHMKGVKTVQILGKELGESSKQIQRYLKITELSPKLLRKLDKGELSFCPAFEIAFLTSDEQDMMADAMEYTQSSPSLSQAQRIKELSREGRLTKRTLIEIMGEVKKGDVQRVIFKNEQLYRFFPREYSPSEMKIQILEILSSWKAHEMEDEEGRKNV